MAKKTMTNTELSHETGTVKKQSRFFAVIKRMMKSRSAAIGTILFLIILLCAIFGDLIAPYDYNQITMEGFQGPSWRHWFGTDPMGRDLLSRILVGAKWSLLIGIGSDGKIKGMHFLSIGETPGLGAKVAQKDYTDNFTGLSTQDDIETVDNLTAATYSSKGLKKACEEVLEFYIVHKREIFA